MMAQNDGEISARVLRAGILDTIAQAKDDALGIKARRLKESHKRLLAEEDGLHEEYKRLQAESDRVREWWGTYMQKLDALHKQLATWSEEAEAFVQEVQAAEEALSRQTLPRGVG